MSSSSRKTQKNESGLSQESKDQPSGKEPASDLVTRPPIVCFLGHVDHGKTSLLDQIRQSEIQQAEAGGITQTIAAYHSQGITFIDTPGHEAFTAMRVRGGETADIAILVVAADDGVKPQTIEAINHIRAAKTPMIVAINKLDLPSANPEKVKQELADKEVMVEEWGGDIVSVECSALTGEGIDDLIEMIRLVADLQELRANPKKQPQGVLIESRLDPKKGPLATVVIREGTLKPRSWVVVGKTYGRIKRMWNDQGETVKKVPPGMPAEILGLNETALAGTRITAVEDEKTAQDQVRQRSATATARPRIIKKQNRKSLPLIVKADADGTLKAVTQSIEKIPAQEIDLDIIHQGQGPVSEADALLAQSSNAVILAFRTTIDPIAKQVIKQNGLLARTYSIIYHLIEDVEKLIGGKEKEGKLTRDALARVLQVFQLSDDTPVAGCKVREGTIRRDTKARVIRNKEEVARGVVSSLRQGKENVTTVKEGEECGIVLTPTFEFQEGDYVETLKKLNIEAVF